MHRKIWESAFGTIPKDDTGRSYEIHHIDKNHNNNALENLKLVTIEEHFNIHFQQGDHGACWAIVKRMNVSVEDSKKIQSIMAKQLARKRIEKGTHNFNSQLSKETQAKRIEEGTHNFQGEQGSLNAIQRNKKLVELGKHPWAGELGKKHNKELSLLRVEKGTHNFQGNSNPNKNMPKVICPHCSKEGGRNQMKRYHFDNCKHKE